RRVRRRGRRLGRTATARGKAGSGMLPVRRRLAERAFKRAATAQVGPGWRTQPGAELHGARVQTGGDGHGRARAKEAAGCGAPRGCCANRRQRRRRSRAKMAAGCGTSRGRGPKRRRWWERARGERGGSAGRDGNAAPTFPRGGVGLGEIIETSLTWSDT